jgi:hypothetical protein
LGNGGGRQEGIPTAGVVETSVSPLARRLKSVGGMEKLGVLSLAVALWGGACASAPPVTPEASLAFQTIQDADVAGAARCPRAAERLDAAKSEADYARHLPGDVEHARRLYLRAQADAELAVVLTRRDAQKHLPAPDGASLAAVAP